MNAIPMDSEQLILYRLDQQDKAQAETRMEMKDSLGRIERQALLTNGRVGSLEKFRWMCAGALLVIGTVIGWIVALHK